MDFEPWWLIIVPVLFGLGWVAGRVDIRQMLSETRNLPDSYFKGLNFILNEQPDRAIDAFVEVAKLDPETTELHFALGSLFRRRGEIERAIRVHQSLLARADLPQAEREHAQHEIGQDFLKAGMLDRAEEAFMGVLDTRFAVSAVRSLIRIYESEHDWPRAIDAVKRLQGLVEEPIPQLVHYQCEQAEAALAEAPPDLSRAVAALDAADAAHQALAGQGSAASAARVAMLRAEVARLGKQDDDERRFLNQVLARAPDYAGLVAARLMASYRQAAQASQGLERLRAHYVQHPGLDTFNVVFREIRAQEGFEPAWQFGREALHKQPSLLGLDRLLESELATGDAPAPGRVSSDTDLQLLRSVIHKHTQRLDRYACRVCGFEAQHFYWQCPGCNSWETYLPKRIEELS